MADRGIKVSVMLVSNVKSRLKNGPTGKKGKRGRPKKSTIGGDYPELRAAKSLVEQVGSIEAAKRALDTFAELRG